MRLAEFEAECRELARRARSCSGWRLSFEEKDFQREYVVTATEGPHSANITVQSARITPGSAVDVLAGLGKLLAELRTGEPDAPDVLRSLRRELEAAQKAIVAATCRVCLQPLGSGQGHSQPFPPSITPPTCPEGGQAIKEWCPVNRWKLCWSGHRWL